MENDGEVRKAFAHFFQNIKFQLRFLTGFEFIGAVAGADSDGQRVHTRTGNKFFHFFGTGIGSVFSADVNVILNTGELAQFPFDNNTVVVGVFHHLFRQSDIFLKGKFGTVNHHRGETTVNAAFADFKIRTMIQMETNRQTGFDNSGFHQFHQIGGIGVFPGTGGYLKNQRRLHFLSGFGNTLNNLHIIDIECADRITAFIGFFKHFRRCYQRHNKQLLFYKIIITDLYIPWPLLPDRGKADGDDWDGI